jgi:two-component system heavy metal sensor histidine kinase CusS
MSRSIRTRLLIWVIGGMAVLLAVLSIMVYEAMRRSLINGFDAVLDSMARSIIGSVEQGREIKVEVGDADLPEFRRSERPGYFQLWREDGTVLARSPSLAGKDLEAFYGRPGVPALRSVRLPDGRPGRAVGILFEPKADDEAPQTFRRWKAAIVVERATTELDSDIAFLRWLLTLAAGGTVLLAFLISAVVVRQGLKPLDALAARIAAIHEEDLSAQLPADRMPSEMQPVAVRINDLLRRLEEAFRRERAFTSDAAHELRTPLAGIRSTLEVALSRPRAPGEYRQAMADSLDIVHRLQVMVDSLLALARLEGGQTSLYPETIQLRELVESGFRTLDAEVRARSLVVVNRIPKELALTVDRESVVRITTILLENAAEYTDEGGRIEVAARSFDSSVEIVFANTGCRLSEEEARHVFERFWRGDSARSDTGVHCGLGLALVRRSVASLGGSARAEVAGGIFTIRVIIPTAGAS